MMRPSTKPSTASAPKSARRLAEGRRCARGPGAGVKAARPRTTVRGSFGVRDGLASRVSLSKAVRSMLSGVSVLESKRVAVVVPAYCEARLIGRTLSGLPEFVDAIYVVDDASTDDTAQAATASNDPRLCVLRHASNQGVGAAIVTGYRAALRDGADVVAVMAGDAQMDPADLRAVVAPVLADSADYVKGNRFRSALRRHMPWPRRLAGKVLSSATRWASGLQVDDCQCGYTAIGRRALCALALGELWPRF